jgi:hypothetical protein
MKHVFFGFKINENLYSRYFYNFILGSFPSLSFFLFFPYYSKFSDKVNLEFTLKILPIFTILYAIDFGINRVVIRISKLRFKEFFLQKVINSYFCNILFYGYIFVIIVLLILNYYNLTAKDNLLGSEFILIILFSPLFIVSNLFFTYFDSIKNSHFNNLVASPILGSTWPILFVLVFFRHDNPLTILLSFIGPKIILLSLQVIRLPFKIQTKIITPFSLLLNDKTSRLNFLSSILSPLCSNLDRILASSIFGGNFNFLIIYNGLSEISRKTGGVIRPIMRIYYQIFEMTDADKKKLTLVNKFISGFNIVLTFFFISFFLFNSGYLNFHNNDLDVLLFSLVCSFVFISTSFLQVNSSINFLLALIKGKLNVIINYQIFQIFTLSFIYFVSACFFDFLFIPLIYLVVRISDYYFLKGVTNE